MIARSVHIMCAVTAALQIGTCVEANGQQSAASLSENAHSAGELEQLAADAALWGMPLVSFDAMRQAIYRDLNASYNTALYWSSPASWKNQTTTPNTVAANLLVFFNTRLSGPMVIDVPPAGEFTIFGSLISAWNAPLVDLGTSGADQGKGGRYVLLPPDSTGSLTAGCFAAPSRTYNNYAVIHIVPTRDGPDAMANALALLRRVRIYPLTLADVPSSTRFIDISNMVFDGVPRFDESFYRSLARMIREEAVQPRDAQMVDRLAALGIERGRRFDPHEAQQTAMKSGAEKAHANLKETAIDSGPLIWPDQQWRNVFDDAAVETRMTFQNAGQLFIDSRAVTFFLLHGPMARPELAGLCIKTFRDRDGNLLTGDNTYTLNIPSEVTRGACWSVAVYDAETCAFIRESQRVALGSLDHQLASNADGSVDITFGSRTPVANERNRISTASGRRFFVVLRRYDSGKGVTQPTCQPGDLEKVQ